MTIFRLSTAIPVKPSTEISIACCLDVLIDLDFVIWVPYSRTIAPARHDEFYMTSPAQISARYASSPLNV